MECEHSYGDNNGTSWVDDFPSASVAVDFKLLLSVGSSNIQAKARSLQNGPLSHLFYMKASNRIPFKNIEKD